MVGHIKGHKKIVSTLKNGKWVFYSMKTLNLVVNTIFGIVFSYVPILYTSVHVGMENNIIEESFQKNFRTPRLLFFLGGKSHKRIPCEGFPFN